jgi:hypothetical protein
LNFQEAFRRCFTSFFNVEMMENSETLSNLDYSKIKDLYINFGIFKEMYEELNGVWKVHILYKSESTFQNLFSNQQAGMGWNENKKIMVTLKKK